jgi:hypothetical protein
MMWLASVPDVLRITRTLCVCHIELASCATAFTHPHANVVQQHIKIQAIQLPLHELESKHCRPPIECVVLPGATRLQSHQGLPKRARMVPAYHDCFVVAYGSKLLVRSWLKLDSALCAEM